jgi:hypothetical protein
MSSSQAEKRKPVYLHLIACMMHLMRIKSHKATRMTKKHPNNNIFNLGKVWPTAYTTGIHLTTLK